MRKATIITAAKDFFFRAMIKGWGSKNPQKKAPGMPCHKCIEFRQGSFFLLDRYCVSPDSNKSAGTITIWHKDVPVWLMNYGGWYDKCAIPVVKEALMRAYEEKMFFGGRGWNMHKKNGIIYVNIPEKNAFPDFSGSEQAVELETSRLLGYHDYWGITLI